MFFKQNCRYCSTQIEKTFKFCYSCGSRIEKEKKNKFILFLVYSLLIFIPILFFIYFLLPIKITLVKSSESKTSNSNEKFNYLVTPTSISATATSIPPIKAKEIEKTPHESIDEKWDKNEVNELSLYALEIINKERIKHGVTPVELGENEAAQIHAEDARKYEYLSHWMMSGEKPYQIYSRTGGDSMISENASFFGWTQEDRNKENCSSIFMVCEKINPKEAIKELTLDMVYDDLICCDNGHRDNLLDPSHLKVNIGIAVDPKNWFLTYYQHFEGGHFVAEEFPVFIKDENIINNKYQNTLKFKIKNLTKEYKFIDSTIRVFFDPMPVSVENSSGKHPNKFEYYCVGGGYSVAGCDDDRDLFVDIIKPGYILQSNKDVHASLWWQKDDFLEVEVEFWDREIKPGIYTIIVFGEHLESERSDQLIELSIKKK
ncbi:MAG: CAP domain-containing protein [Dehalococcoidia bacterium]